MVNDAADMVNGRLISPWATWVGLAVGPWAAGPSAGAPAQHIAVIARAGGRSSTPRREWVSR